VSGRRYDVLVLGEPLLERHTDATGCRIGPDSVSGDAFNSACAAALAGARVALLTALGRDEGGEQVMSELERRGIGTEHVVRDDRPTGAYTIAPDAEGRPAFTYQRAGSAAAALGPADLARWRAAVEETLVLVTGGVCAALSAGTEALVREAVGASHRAGRAVCYDVNFRPRLTTPEAALRALRSVARHCRLIKIATPADSGPLLNHVAATDVITALRVFTGADLIVTDGENPLTLAVAGVRTLFPVVPSPAFVDATGAGDVLIGTLAAALSLGTDPAAAMPEAMAAASLSTCGRGGAPYASLAEARALLRDHV